MDAIEVGDLVQQRSQASFNPPINLAVWQMPLEQTKHRQSLNNVAKRTWLENENFHASYKRSARLRPTEFQGDR